MRGWRRRVEKRGSRGMGPSAGCGEMAQHHRDAWAGRGGGVPVAEVVQETHGGVRGTRTLEHDVAAQCRFKFI
jgi:hypothetical protein